MRNELETLREGMIAHRIVTDERVRSCGRNLAEGSGAATLELNITSRTATFAGLCRCGNVHTCPVCATRIHSVRGDDAETFTNAWMSAGHGIAMMTVTLRHYERMALGSLRKGNRHGLVAVQHDAWMMAFGSLSGKNWQKLKHSYGLKGWARAWECTHSHAAGWHPHFHVLLFLDAPLSEEEARDFEARLRDRWGTAVKKAGGYQINEHGLKLDQAAAGDESKLARYLFKYADGQARFTSLAQEVTRGDRKKGRRGSRTPFQIAADAVAFLDSGDRRKGLRDRSIFQEYEAATYNLRSLYWSNGFRKVLAELVELEERTDAEIAAADEEGERVPVCGFPWATWHRHVLPVRGRVLELKQAAEKRGPAAVRALVESWGLVWGEDVWTPERTVREAQERAEAALIRTMARKVETDRKVAAQREARAAGGTGRSDRRDEVRAAAQQRQADQHRLDAEMDRDARQVASRNAGVQLATGQVAATQQAYLDGPQGERRKRWEDFTKALNTAHRVESAAIAAQRPEAAAFAEFKDRLRAARQDPERQAELEASLEKFRETG
ncbi:hypothetical protein ACFY7H_33760 [Streptomyces sp. NPDC012794]|uniref:hypothetical protein n=1 Tax=Streptomyces sp. NPDC012794 TaxID=3364850 RepID=UPI00369AB101